MEITKQREYGEYIPVGYVADIFDLTPEIILTLVKVLHDLSFLEYSDRLKEGVRLTISGQLANLEDYIRTSNSFEQAVKVKNDNLKKKAANFYNLLPSFVFSRGH
jgi:hypothetical protein